MNAISHEGKAKKAQTQRQTNAMRAKVSESMEKLIDKFEADDDLWLGKWKK